MYERARVLLEGFEEGSRKSDRRRACHRFIEPLLSESFERQTIHGDAHINNVLATPNVTYGSITNVPARAPFSMTWRGLMIHPGTLRSIAAVGTVRPSSHCRECHLDLRRCGPDSRWMDRADRCL